MQFFNGQVFGQVTKCLVLKLIISYNEKITKKAAE